MKASAKNNKSWAAGLLSAAAASLCCITPLLALLGGATGIASSFSWVEPLRPYLIGITVLVFAFAWYQKLKPIPQVDCECLTETNNSFWQSKSFLGIITIVASLLILFPYYSNSFNPKPKELTVVTVDTSYIQQATFKIKGMTCEACTQHVNNEISKLGGIISYNTSYRDANSVVKFDNTKTSIDSIAAAINSTGYKVSSQQ